MLNEKNNKHIKNHCNWGIGVGHFIHEKLENKLTRFAPGYSLVKETVAQFLGKKKSPFSQVALVQLFETKTLATAFVTDEHSNGMVTVFVPTGPNPTSGQIFHLESKYVFKVDVGIEVALRSIISCGAGSKPLIDFKNSTINTNGEVSGIDILRKTRH